MFEQTITELNLLIDSLMDKDQRTKAEETRYHHAVRIRATLLAS